MKNLILLLILFSPCLSHAYYSLWDTGEVLPQDKYELNVETQFVTSSDSGVNLVGRFDMGVQEDSSFRAMIGLGTTDFHLGAFYKWIPIPDTETQPAIGVMGGIVYAHDEGEEIISLRAYPLISKNVTMNFGVVTPYASIPIGLRSADDDTDLTVQVAVGTDVKTEHFHNIRWRLEIGFDLNDEAYSYVSLGAVLRFDQENGIEFN